MTRPSLKIQHKKSCNKELAINSKTSLNKVNFDEAITGLENSDKWPMPTKLQGLPEQSFNRHGDYNTRYNEHKSWGGKNVFNNPDVINIQPQRSRLRVSSNPAGILEKFSCYSEAKAPCQGLGRSRKLTKARNFSKRKSPSNFYTVWPKNRVRSLVSEANVFSQYPLLDSSDKRSMDCLDGESGPIKTHQTPRRKNPNKNNFFEV